MVRPLKVAILPLRKVVLVDHVPRGHALGQYFELPFDESGYLWNLFLAELSDVGSAKRYSDILTVWPVLVGT